MAERVLNVLFLCTGNSARSIMAEALLNCRGRGRFRAYSAGSMPKGKVHPLALEILKQNNLDPSGYRSKGWEEFAAEDAPKIDYVFTVCDNAANEVCPVWPGHPMTAHWGIADPDQPGMPIEQQKRLFSRAYAALDQRIRIFTALPLAGLEREALQGTLDDIGKLTPGIDPDPQ